MTNYENKMTAQFNFMGYGEEEVLFDVHPILHDGIEFEINIRPQNGMTAIYDLVETPTISLPVHPVEDAYITTDTPYNSINTGDARSMLIGRDIKGEHRGLIKFDLSFIDPMLHVKGAKLRIYYSNLIPNTVLNLYTVNGEWNEYSVTYLNKPNIKDFLTSDYVINEDESYIEFNVSPIVSNWIKGIPNDGFYLLSSDFASTFRTRESFYSPILFVDYKDFSYKLSYSKSEFEVQVKALGDNDIEFDVEVGETYTTDDIEWEVFAHDPNHTYTEDIEWELTSVEIIPTLLSEDIKWEVVSTKSDSNQIQWEVTIPEHNDEDAIEWELTVEIPSPYTNADNSIEWEIDVLGLHISSENTIEFDIIANEYSDESDIEFEVEAREYDDSTIEFEIEIAKGNENSDLEFEVGVWGYYDSDIEFEIHIPHSDIEFDVTPLFSDENEIEFEVIPRIPYVSDVEFEVTVPVYLDDSDIEFEVEAIGYGRYAYAFII